MTVDNAETLAKAVDALAETPARRAELAARALTVGDRYFSYAAARSVFHGAVATGARNSAPFRSRKLLTPLFNRVALATFRAMPSLLARHLMFVLRSHPELTDDWAITSDRFTTVNHCPTSLPSSLHKRSAAGCRRRSTSTYRGRSPC